MVDMKAEYEKLREKKVAPSVFGKKSISVIELIAFIVGVLIIFYGRRAKIPRLLIVGLAVIFLGLWLG